jgi:Ca-activated chloride channel family protein
MTRILAAFAAALCWCLSTHLFAQSLSVQDPQRTWRYSRGTIEEATLSIRPKGVYMEYSLYLTFSSRGTSYTASSDVLEIQYFFNLPTEAIVTDSWLWVGNDIIRAQLLDRWTASTIYEGIVQRRRDPSILSKTGAGRYELRVYPLEGPKTRKVKITYLMPTLWTATTVSAALPMELLRTSLYGVPLNLVYWPSQTWQSPRIDELTGLKFSTSYDATLKADYQSAKVDATTLAAARSLTFSVNAPLKNGVYFNHFNDGEEGVYQMVYLPSQSLDVMTPKKVAFLFDYDPSKSYTSILEVFNTVKSMLRTQFTSRDSFNVILSRFEVARQSEQWLPADSASIERVFSGLTTASIAMYSNLPALLANGMSFVKARGGDGSLMLIANSDQVGNSSVANQLIKDIGSSSSSLPPVHIADFIQYPSAYYINGAYNYGNEYFYSSLARLTNGTYNRLYSSSWSSLSSMLTNQVAALGGIVTAFDFITTMKNGFCFARYSMGTASQTPSALTPIVQVGKYRGSMPFVVQASGILKSKAFSKTLELGPSEVFFGDSTNKSIWAGSVVRSLEGATQSNSTIRDIVDYSLRNRVLSNYTAFLALEPNDTVKPCTNCYDESRMATSVQGATALDSVLLAASPNPFSDETVLSVELPSAVKASTISIAIYNLLGQPVVTLQPDSFGTGRLTLRWRGEDEARNKVPVGTYFLVVNTPAKRFMLKLVKTE